MLRYMLWVGIALVMAACGATAVPLVPTDRPTITPTFTVTISRTPGAAAPTSTPTVAGPPTGGPSPTSLFGPTRTPAPDDPTPTPILNPNAPRIEFFTSDLLAVEPGTSVTLFWSTRGTDNAVIYRLDSKGQREQLWNVAPDGNLTVPTRRSDRGQLQFMLIVGEGSLQVQQPLVIPLACPIKWFFSPSPGECPKEEAQPTNITEQVFERGRMIHVEARNVVYALFNDNLTPAWIAFENRYDPAVHPESIESFVPPPGFHQPIAALGFVWRGNDTVRNRLGLGIDQEVSYEGFIQSVTTAEGADHLYISSADGTVILVLPGGASWQIITPP